MGSPRWAASLLLLLLLLIGLSALAGIGCPYLPRWSTHCLLASHMEDTLTGRFAHIPCHTQLAFPVSLKPWCAQLWLCPYLCLHLVSDPSGLREGWFHLLVQKYKKSYKFRFCRRHKMPTSAQANHVLCLQRKLLSSCCLSEKGHHIAVSSPDISHKGLRSKRTQPSDLKALEGLPRPSSQRHEGPEFSFDLLPEARAIQVTIPPGPEVSMRLCHQWVLECEELSSPFDSQKIVSGGHAVELPYEFLLPCLCIEASYLQEDTVRHKKCPFRNWPEAYGSDFWKSVHFTDYSQHSQMVMALTLRCPLKLEASLCQRQGWHTICEDLPNATAQESEGWYVLEGVDLHPQLCFKFSFGNSSHVECPHRTAPSWNVSMDTQAQQLVLHFSSRIHATFSAAWSQPSLGQDSLVHPVYSISQEIGFYVKSSGSFLKGYNQIFFSFVKWVESVRYLTRLSSPLGRLDVHQRWALVWLACLLLASVLFLLFLFKKDHVKGWLRLLKEDLRAGAAPRGRAALLLYSAEDSGFERLVGALASALCQLPLRVAVDLWSRRELSAQGPLAWFHAQRRQTLQDGGVVVLLFSPGAVALCHEWLQDGAAASAPHGPHDAFAASLSCVLPDFLQGRAPGRYVGAYFDGLLHSEAVPALFRSVPVFSLPSQLPDFLGTLQGPAVPRPGRLGERAKQVSRALQPALDQLLQAPGAPGDCTRDGT
ncbi:interleukin-17 receptor E [Leptonychotes weddellii]|uniref:Interleukin-17 receptor C n=1 Tax=Leptonychotes weddellii TaxID=9713 RepID=A0A7F8RA65_LEPWE|nr:interleukin-17 receptor E [Leptonychotes weddellii]